MAEPVIRDLGRQEMLGLLAELRREVARIVPGGLFDATPGEVVMLSLFWRAVRLYDAVVALLEMGLPEEASVLARSSFEESLKLRELGENPESRAGLVVRLVQDALQNKRRLFHEAARLQLETALDQVLAHLVAEEEKLMAFKRKHGIHRTTKFLSVIAAANRYGRREDLWFHELTHQFVHGTDLAMIFSRKKQRAGELLLHDRTHELWFAAGVAAFASRSLVHAVLGAAQIFGWKGAEGLSELQSKLEALRDQARCRHDDETQTKPKPSEG